MTTTSNTGVESGHVFSSSHVSGLANEETELTRRADDRMNEETNMKQVQRFTLFFLYLKRLLVRVNMSE